MEDAGLRQLAAEMRASAWELALDCVEETTQDEAIPSLARIGRLAQIGDVPTFIGELARELDDPQPARLDRESRLAGIVRDHAREREALGFTPRDIVTEFLVLRRVLWRFVSGRAAAIGSQELLVAERRLNDAIDRLVTECVVAYFETATSELAHRARQDALTELLNHQALSHDLDVEIARAKRYRHGLALVFFDIDRFKEINDTLGHPEGDQVLRSVARILRESLRANDLAGRMGGDEFAAVLIESDAEAAGVFVERLLDRFDEAAAHGELPAGFAVSVGVAHYPTDARDADGLFRAADRRLYRMKGSSPR
jgi:diguanylate cyclase (GGDEF)-like protein